MIYNYLTKHSIVWKFKQVHSTIGAIICNLSTPTLNVTIRGLYVLVQHLLILWRLDCSWRVSGRKNMVEVTNSCRKGFKKIYLNSSMISMYMELPSTLIQVRCYWPSFWTFHNLSKNTICFTKLLKLTY